jgi:hypothetical protein
MAQRELSTDRPDKTESPQTVDAGRFQIELDLATYTFDRSGDERRHSISAVPFNLKYGMDRDTDIQLIVAPYQRQTVTDMSGGRTSIAGFGDVTLRVKHNLWGNDSGKTALAIMHFVTLPTARDGLGAEGVAVGLIVPLSVKLSDEVGLGLMTQVDAVREDGRYRASFINSVTLAFSLTDHLGAYTEIYAEHTQGWVVTGDAGLTYAIGEDIQLDLGLNLGLSTPADDVAMFVGVSRRF